MDVEASPIAELPLSEIYNESTSTIKDDYLLVFQDSIKLPLESTYGLGDRSRLHLLNARFITLHRKANGDLLSLRKPAMGRLIQQTIQQRVDTGNSVSVSILIKFHSPGFFIPQRSHDSPRIPPKIRGIRSIWNLAVELSPSLI